MKDDITYGGLMDRADECLSMAWRQLRLDPPTEALAIRQSILEFRDVGHALTHLAGHLTQGSKVWGAGWLEDPRLGAAGRLVGALATDFRTRPEPLDDLPADGVGAWLKAAAVAIRTAGDLLATHTFPDGRWQTPESAALDDPSARLVAIARISDMAVLMSHAQPALVAAAHQRESLTTWMRSNRPPHMQAARAFAGELRSLVPRHTGSIIDNITVANPRIRCGDPVAEVQDRVERLRVAAWRAAVYPSVETGVPTLIDFATAAVLLHGGAAVLAAAEAGCAVRDVHAPADVRRLIAGAERWRGLHRRLATLLSPSISDPAVTENVRALRALITHLTAKNGAVKPDQVTAVRNTVRAFEEIAASNALSVRALFAAGLLDTPGKLVPMDEAIGIEPLSTGRLVSVIPATGLQVSKLLTGYAEAHSSHLNVPDLDRPPPRAPGPGI